VQAELGLGIVIAKGGSEMAVEAKVYSDSEVVELYREWSEASFAASWMGADDYREYVAEFSEWLEVKESLPALLLDYEKAMLAEYRKQDAIKGG
jgi:hypothetical protein